MRSYSIEDLLVGTYYRPTSIAKRSLGGVIEYAEKRDDVWVDNGNAYAVRYRVEDTHLTRWATVFVATEEN